MEEERERAGKMSRNQMTQRMVGRESRVSTDPTRADVPTQLSTRGKELNPITNSDLYSSTDHFVSTSTGHQVSNRGGGSSGKMTYWEVRTAKAEQQAREKVGWIEPGLFNMSLCLGFLRLWLWLRLVQGGVLGAVC